MKNVMVLYGGSPENSFIIDVDENKVMSLVQKFTFCMTPDAVEVTIDVFVHEVIDGETWLLKGVNGFQCDTIKCNLVSIRAREDSDVYELATPSTLRYKEVYDSVEEDSML